MEIDTGTPAFRETAALQETVSAPGVSAWVSANAGSGKTHVLTGRVIRLLMGAPPAVAPVDPDRILCITFTKAAAAEMQNRLFATLGAWALSPDDALRATLDRRFGPDPDRDLGAVRQLFARALETPGGLKIKTIHGFCEGLLSRFPVEAGLTPGFVVADDAATGTIRQAAWQAVLEAQDPDAARLAPAVLSLLRELGPQGLLTKAEGLAKEGNDPDTLRGRLGLVSRSRDAVIRDALSYVGRPFVLGLLRNEEDILAEPKCNSKSRWAAITRFVKVFSEAAPGTEAALFDMACAAFLKEDGLPCSLRNGAPFVRARYPTAEPEASAIGDALSEAVRQIRLAEALGQSRDLRTLGLSLTTRIAAAMEEEALVDFDGLIARTSALFDSISTAWIDTKIDGGLSHILLDEAQDTGTSQWPILRHIRRRILSHRPDNGRHRTVFVVGDKKQSIYSFQGADAALFDKERDATQGDAGEGRFHQAQLFLSFRSAPALLSAVDAFFDGPAGDGVSTDVIRHAAARPALPGEVVLWPLVRKPETTDDDLWTLPVDARGPAHPFRQLSELICEDILRFVNTAMVGDKETSRPRRARFGDVMILCQKRTGIYPDLLRTLSLKGIPNAGPDRLSLTADIAVRDMMSALKVAANHDDCLSLAEVLKSPLCGMDEDALMSLAHGRGRQSLWARLISRAAEDPALLRVREMFEAAERAGRNDGPFAFLTRLLEDGTPSGWQRFRARLGVSSDDALAELLSEALSYEAQTPRSLEGFLAHLSRLDTDLKREGGDTEDVVRVMTVHGAKGLEAPCVYLADASVPAGQMKDPLVPLLNEAGEDDGIRILKTSGLEKLSAAVEDGVEFRKRAAFAEYRRQFYVAATRAEQRLVICGTEQGRWAKSKFTGPDDKLAADDPGTATWYGLAAQALDRLADTVNETDVPWSDRPARQFGPGLLSADSAMPAAPAVRPATKTPAQAAPPWLYAAAPHETPRDILQPSQPEAPDLADPEGPFLRPRRPGDRIPPRERGILIHKLLEVLPVVTPSQRREKGTALLARTTRNIAEAARAEFLEEALMVLNDPRFAEVFSIDARAEVAVRGTVRGHRVSGQIDRLSVTPGAVLCVDYKTMRPPPDTPEATPPGIIRQMALYRELLRGTYPDRPVETAVLYTYAPKLLPLPPAALDAALESLPPLPPCA